MNIIFRETVSGESVVENFPTGREVIIQTDADLSVAFWNPAAREYSTALPVSAPQAVLVCPSAKAKITTATTADVNVALSVSPTADVVKTVSQTLTDPQKATAQKNIALSGTGDPNGSGLAASFTVSGDLTDGTNPITVPTLLPVAGAPGNWTDTGTLDRPVSGRFYHLYKIEGQDGYEFLVFEDDATISGWFTVSNAATPDLADGWLPSEPATGTPVFTSSGPALLAEPGTEYRQLSEETGDLAGKWICRTDGVWERLDIDATNADAVAALLVTPETVLDAVEAMDAGQKESVRRGIGISPVGDAVATAVTESAARSAIGAIGVVDIGAGALAPVEKMVCIGDSITDGANGTSADYSGVTHDATRWPVQLEMIAGGRALSVGPTAANTYKIGALKDRDHGYSGITAYFYHYGHAAWGSLIPVTDAIAAAVAADPTKQKVVCIVHLGTNDMVVNGTDANVVIANIRRVWSDLTAQGLRVIGTDVLQRASAGTSGWATVGPTLSPPVAATALRDRVNTVNAALRAAWESDGLEAYLPWDLLVDKDASGYALDTELNGDGLHPSQRTAAKLAMSANAYFRSINPVRPYGGSPYPIPPLGSARWITPNPHMQGDSSGMATSWTLYQYGTVGVDYTVQKIHDEHGIWQRINRLTNATLAFPGVGLYARLTSGTSPTAASYIGRRVRVTARIRVAAGSEFRSIGLVSGDNSTPGHFMALQANAPSVASYVMPHDEIYCSDEFTLPSGMDQLWAFVSHGYGKGTFDVKEVGVFLVD